MDITTGPIAAAMEKGLNDKCEVSSVKIHLYIADRLSLEHCHSCVRSSVAGYSNTDVMTPVAWLWCH